VLLRQVRRREPDAALQVVSAGDPLNLVGSLLPGAKVPAVSGNRLLYRDGVPVAVQVAGRCSYLVDAPAQEQEQLPRLKNTACAGNTPKEAKLA
jgi:ATP-dependent Lhr-like helicase